MESIFKSYIRTAIGLKNWFGNSLRKVGNKMQEYNWKLGQRIQRENKNYLQALL